MKKVESVLDGSLGCGKNRTLATFPQILFCPHSLILPKIFTIQGGEAGASASHPHVEALPKRLIRSYLTLQKIKQGKNMKKKIKKLKLSSQTKECNKEHELSKVRGRLDPSHPGADPGCLEYCSVTSKLDMFCRFGVAAGRCIPV